jgi:hypothetical protein
VDLTGPAQLNRYTYVQDDPIDLRDPSGFGPFADFAASVATIVRTAVLILVELPVLLVEELAALGLLGEVGGSGRAVVQILQPLPAERRADPRRAARPGCGKWRQWRPRRRRQWRQLGAAERAAAGVVIQAVVCQDIFTMGKSGSS